MAAAAAVGLAGGAAADVSIPPAPDPVMPAAAPAPPVLGPRPLGLGASGAAVRALQRALRARGLRVTVDGAFGADTRRAVRALQRRLGLEPSGVADAALLGRLGIVLQRAAGVRLAPLPRPVAHASAAVWLRAFPVRGPHSYVSDFGAPRGQGTHDGNDIMAARGTPVVAVADGVIQRLTRVESGLGGIWIWMRDTRGNTYYYAHLQAISDGLAPGSAVRVGQQIATVGNTGDARSGPTHLHFEIHPGAGVAVDPYADLRAVDPVGGRA